MSQRSRKTQNEYIGASIEISTIIADVKKSIWIIISLSISISLLSYIFRIESYVPSYQVETIFTVTSRGINNNLLTNMSTAQKMANRYAQIFTSSTLQADVVKETGVEAEDFRVSALAVQDTNLVIVRVTSETPQNTYLVMRSMMKNYPKLSEYLVTDALIDVLSEPQISGESLLKINPVDTLYKSFFISLFALVLLMTGISCMKDTIRNTADIGNKLDVKCLGVIVHEKRTKRAVESKSTESFLINKRTVSFQFSESVLKTSRKIINRMSRVSAKTLLITSCLEKEGKSTIVSNLALAMAEQGKRVAVVDFDFRCPSQYKIFKLLKEDVSNTDYYSGTEAKDYVVIRIPDTDIFGVFNSKTSDNSNEILISDFSKGLIAHLKKQFDFVIIDSPAMSESADAETIAAYVDASIVVIRQHVAKSKNINDILDILFATPSVLLGCILNDYSGNYGKGIGGRGYSRYYESQYGYGHYDT